MNDNMIEPDVLKERKKMPKEIKDKILNLVFFNIIFLIIMSVITFIINVSFNKLNVSDFKNYIKFVQMALCIISIVLFEVAYKKDTMKIGFFAIEFVIFSCSVLFVPYKYISKSDSNFLKIVLGIYVLYYLIKSSLSAISIRHKYLKDNMSDIKELVKDEKKSYLDEESKKTLKERKLEEENKKVLKQVKNTKKSDKIDNSKNSKSNNNKMKSDSRNNKSKKVEE